MDLRARVETLNAQRLNAWNQGQELLIATEGRAMSGEELQTYTRISTEIDAIDAEVRQLVATTTREREADALRALTMSAFGEVGAARNDKAGQDQFRQWLNAPRGSEFRTAGFEIDVQRVRKERDLLRQGASDDEIRALAWDATSGSLVVPTTMARSLYDKLEAGIAAFRMGATTMNTASGENMQLPKLLTHGAATQVSGQGTTLAGTDATFGRVNLNVNKYAELVKVANELVGDSAFDIAGWLGGDLGYALSRKIDTDLVTSAAGNITGFTVLAGAGTNAPITTGGSLIAPTVEKFIDLQYSVPDPAIDRSIWLMKASVAATVRKLRDGAGGTVGAFLWNPSLTNGLQGGQPDRFLNSPVYMDTNCAAAGSNATLATYGDPAEYVIRTVGNPVIERDDSIGFASDEAWFRGKWRVGGNHRDPGVVNNLVQNV
jgi:HK97 family phage major capsid protein